MVSVFKSFKIDEFGKITLYNDVGGDNKQHSLKAGRNKENVAVLFKNKGYLIKHMYCHINVNSTVSVFTIWLMQNSMI